MPEAKPPDPIPTSCACPTHPMRAQTPAVREPEGNGGGSLARKANPSTAHQFRKRLKCQANEPFGPRVSRSAERHLFLCSNSAIYRLSRCDFKGDFCLLFCADMV